MGIRKKYSTPHFGPQGDKAWADYKERNKATIANTKSKTDSKIDVNRGSVNLKTTGMQSEGMSPYTYKAPKKVSTQEDFSKRNNSYTGDKAPTYDSMPGKDFAKDLEVSVNPNVPNVKEDKPTITGGLSSSRNDMHQQARNMIQRPTSTEDMLKRKK